MQQGFENIYKRNTDISLSANCHEIQISAIQLSTQCNSAKPGIHKVMGIYIRAMYNDKEDLMIQLKNDIPI